jgi:hypothetical protein
VIHSLRPEHQVRSWEALVAIETSRFRKNGAPSGIGERQLALCARAKGVTTNGALSYSAIFRMIASGASPNELQRLSPSVTAPSNERKNWCRPPHSLQIGTLGAERTPRSMLPHWLLPFGRQKATALSVKFRNRSECVFAGQHRRSARKKGHQRRGEWRPCARPRFARGRRLTRNASLYSAPRQELCLTYPRDPQRAWRIGRCHEPLSRSALHFEVSSWGPQCAVGRVS